MNHPAHNGSRLKPKHQRLVLIVIALIALIGAGLLAAYALRGQANYFYLPEQMQADPPEMGQAVRLGGMVEQGSLVTDPDGVTLRFAVTGNDGSRIPVQFSGIAPDLFVEGSGVVAEGRLAADGTFVADNLLAKHDENYVPRELEGMSQRQVAEVTEETTVGIE